MFSWTGFLTYAFITGFTPGPNNIICLSNGSRFGFRASLPFNFGVISGFAVIMTLCTIFCSLLTDLIPKIELPMKILGAAYMLFLAWKVFKSKPELEEGAARMGYLTGVALQFINVKLYLYCIVSLQVYIIPFYADNTPALLGFGLILTLIGFASNMSWLAFGNFFKLLFSKYAKVTNTVMALLLVYCAVSLFF